MEYTKTILKGGEGEIVEKKSRFISHIAPVTTEEEAVSFVNSIKKKHYDARHNCFAYIIGRKGDIKRFSDDGEPSGTAGRPILDILEREGIYNAVIVVTRYFGGTLLGTGGLVRAYQASSQEGLRNSSVAEKLAGEVLAFSADYGLLGKLQYYFNKEGINILKEEYGVNIDYEIIAGEGAKAKILADLSEMSEGALEVTEKGSIEYIISDGQLIL